MPAMEILSTRYEPWGIDVDIHFVDNRGVDHITTMRFDSDEQIETEWRGRVERQIAMCGDI